jgi:hypothetical protein
MSNLRRVFSIATVTILLVAMATSVQASVFLGSIYVSGVNNTIEDQNREAFIDRSPGSDTPDGVFGIGDVLIGWARADDHVTPGGFGPLGNRVYGIFSQQVVDVNNTGATYEIIFDATTVPGLTLAAITGNPLIHPEGIVAVYDNVVPIPINLITGTGGPVPDTTTGPPAGAGTYPGAPPSGTVNIWDYFAHIINNSGPAPEPSFVAGIGNLAGAVLTTPGSIDIASIGGPAAFAPLPDHFIARTTPFGSALIAGGFPLAGLPTVATSTAIASFESGLTILQNNDAAVTYARLVGATETGGGFLGITHDLSITRGAVGGTAGAVNAAEWDNINPDSPLSNPGGFTTDALESPVTV